MNAQQVQFMLVLINKHQEQVKLMRPAVREKYNQILKTSSHYTPKYENLNSHELSSSN